MDKLTKKDKEYIKKYGKKQWDYLQKARKKVNTAAKVYEKEINEMDKTYMKYMNQGSGGKYKDKTGPNKTKEPKKFQGDGGVNDGPVNEVYNNVDEYPKADAKGGSKTEYPVKNKPEKKKKPKDGWQGDDGGVSDVVEKKLRAEVPMSFDLEKYAAGIDAYAKVLEKLANEDTSELMAALGTKKDKERFKKKGSADNPKK